MGSTKYALALEYVLRESKHSEVQLTSRTRTAGRGLKGTRTRRPLGLFRHTLITVSYVLLLFMVIVLWCCMQHPYTR